MSQQKIVNAPPTFTDAEKRTWTINLTLDLLDQVLADTQIDLAPDDNDVSSIVGLLFNHRKLGAVLWCCCSDQAERLEVDQKSFKKSLDSEALSLGWGALADAIVFFIQSRSPKLAEAIQAAIEAEMRVLEAGANAAIETLKSQETDTKLKAAAARIGKQMQGEISKALADSATNSLPSSRLSQDLAR